MPRCGSSRGAGKHDEDDLHVAPLEDKGAFHRGGHVVCTKPYRLKQCDEGSAGRHWSMIAKRQDFGGGCPSTQRSGRCPRQAVQRGEGVSSMRTTTDLIFGL